MNLDENHSSPPLQPHDHLTTSLFGQSSILDIPHHGPKGTPFSTEPTQNRIFVASSGLTVSEPSGQSASASASPQISCFGAAGHEICEAFTAVELSTWGSVITVPPASSYKRTSMRPSSQMVSGTPATTLQTLTTSFHRPSQMTTNDVSFSSTQLPSNQVQTTASQPTPTSNDTNQPETHQSGPMVVYIILGVFVGFGIVCALVTNRRIVNWTQNSVKKRREMEEIRRKADDS